MKPWREIATPHSDVLKGTFQQAEFAADITAVRTNKAPDIYQKATAFFDRTYITEGMRLLLTQVAQRLSGKGGEPVIQLQTAFGGGKTHTMLAVWHLANRSCKLSDLPGVPPIIEQAGLMDLPRANVAVIDGTAHAPSQPWKQGNATIKTLWGELAWQLGGSEGFALVRESDANGTSPGKEVLRQLFDKYAPCIILMDEMVAYIRQFPEGKALSGGTFESNISFIQALTEATKQVPTAVLLASLPESDPKKDKNLVQVGGERGLLALHALEDVFGRVQALWKPVGTEEAFEIVRRRLFEPIKDEKTRDNVCREFINTYISEGAKLPSETQEGRYFDRLCQAYPIHPEFFDRLYEDWTTIDGFQRTRGVLKLMAKVIHRLWKDNNQDLMIMPGSLPLADTDVRNEMVYHLPPGWDPVIEGDIDGERAETTELETKEPRFGQINAARRVARTLFLGSAPSSVATKSGIRGLDRGRVLLGCQQPGQTSAIYSDALNRIADCLHYLNSTGDKAADTTRFWFDTRANLRREMEDRKRRFDDKTDVLKKIEEVAKKLFNNSSIFEGVHAFTAHADVPDDSGLRLVLLSPDQVYIKEAPRQAEEAVLEYLRSHGSQPRHRANRLIFIAPDKAVLNRLRDAVRVALAWKSIVDDVDEGLLNIDQAQKKQAQKETQSSSEKLLQFSRETFKWLLCPEQDDPQASSPSIEAFALNTTSGTPAGELERVCRENELIIDTWSPIHLRSKLKELYWRTDRSYVEAKTFWEDTQKYLYLPRLKDRNVLAAVIQAGSATKDFFGIAYGYTNGKYDGFQFGTGCAGYDDTVLLIEPGVASKYAESQIPAATSGNSKSATTTNENGGENQSANSSNAGTEASSSAGTKVAHLFRGNKEVDATLAQSELNTIALEVIDLLFADPNAKVKVTIEIDAEFPNGVSDTIKRGVSENATNLGFRMKEWE